MQKYEKLDEGEREKFANAVFGALENGGLVLSEREGAARVVQSESAEVADAVPRESEEAANAVQSESEGTARRTEEKQRGGVALMVSQPDIMFALGLVTPEWKREEHLKRLGGIGNAVERSDPAKKFLRGGPGSKEWQEHLGLYAGFLPEGLTEEGVERSRQICMNLAKKQASGQQLSANERQTLAKLGKIVEFEDLRKKLSIDMGFVEAREAEERERSNLDSENMERFFLFYVEQNNWFYDAVDEDPTRQTQIVTTTATAEVDDRFNHIDVACAALGEATGYRPLIFGVDFTCRRELAEIHKKMQWEHVYGRREDRIEQARRDPRVGLAGTQITPAGPAPKREDAESENDFKQKMFIWKGKRFSDYNLKKRFRRGMKIPGFTTLNYAWFNEVENDRRYPKGEQKITERIVVGASSEVLQILVSPKPDAKSPQFVGDPAKYQRALTRFRQGQDMASRVLKWCTLLECRQQAQDIATMLQELSPAEVQRIEREAPGELQQAREESARAAAYFTEAVEKARQQTGVREHPTIASLARDDLFTLRNPEQVAYECAIRDEVLQKICEESQRTYLER